MHQFIENGNRLREPIDKIYLGLSKMTRDSMVIFKNFLKKINAEYYISTTYNEKDELVAVRFSNVRITRELKPEYRDLLERFTSVNNDLSKALFVDIIALLDEYDQCVKKHNYDTNVLKKLHDCGYNAAKLYKKYVTIVKEVENAT